MVLQSAYNWRYGMKTILTPVNRQHFFARSTGWPGPANTSIDWPRIFVRVGSVRSTEAVRVSNARVDRVSWLPRTQRTRVSTRYPYSALHLLWPCVHFVLTLAGNKLVFDDVSMTTAVEKRPERCLEFCILIAENVDHRRAFLKLIFINHPAIANLSNLSKRRNQKQRNQPS